jgi:hypothetical protein
LKDAMDYHRALWSIVIHSDPKLQPKCKANSRSLHQVFKGIFRGRALRVWIRCRRRAPKWWSWADGQIFRGNQGSATLYLHGLHGDLSVYLAIYYYSST